MLQRRRAAEARAYYDRLAARRAYKRGYNATKKKGEEVVAPNVEPVVAPVVAPATPQGNYNMAQLEDIVERQQIELDRRNRRQELRRRNMERFANDPNFRVQHLADNLNVAGVEMEPDEFGNMDDP